MVSGDLGWYLRIISAILKLAIAKICKHIEYVACETTMQDQER